MTKKVTIHRSKERIRSNLRGRYIFDTKGGINSTFNLKNHKKKGRHKADPLIL